MGSKLKPAGQLHYLSARQVVAAKAGTKVSDGGGLVLTVGDDGSARWSFRYTSPTGKRREAGLGVVMRDSVAAAGQSLTAARDLAHEARQLLRQGRDPLDERDANKQARRKAEEEKKAAKARERRTLRRACRDYHERVVEPNLSTKHGQDWIASIENHLPAALLDSPIDGIDAPTLLEALLDIRPHPQARRKSERLHETVGRIRQRLDVIFQDQAFYGRVTGNPAAAIKTKLRKSLGRRMRSSFRSLDYEAVPAFMVQLRQASGTAARALEFCVLCAARTREVLFAEWSEFDLRRRLWVVPAERMKANEQHTVFLSDRAVAIIEAQRGQDERFVFPSTMPSRAGQPLSNMSMLSVLKRLGLREQTTVHGLARSCFSTWANENGIARPDVVECALAHREGDKVRAAYNKAGFAAERRMLLAAWADYCVKPALTLAA